MSFLIGDLFFSLIFFSALINDFQQCFELLKDTKNVGVFSCHIIA
jgi:hypothetical protein